MAKVLVVDDSASMRQMVSFALKSAGHSTIEAEDGKKALDICSQVGSIDLVLTDVNMPVMDGITLVKNLRGMPSFKFTPILMLTTESSADKKTQGKAAGATGWIVKPFTPDKLVSTVARVL